MGKSLFNELGGQRTQPQDGGFAGMMAEFNRFQNSFRGNANQEIDRLRKTGTMTEAQYNQCCQIAKRLMPFFKR